LAVFTPSLAKIASKTLVNLASRSRMTKRNAEVHEQVAGLLSSPCAVWVGGQALDVHMAGLDLHDEQHVQASEEDGAGVEEVAGQ
jgi:hypothetical protein